MPYAFCLLKLGLLCCDILILPCLSSCPVIGTSGHFDTSPLKKQGNSSFIHETCSLNSAIQKGEARMSRSVVHGCPCRFPYALRYSEKGLPVLPERAMRSNPTVRWDECASLNQERLLRRSLAPCERTLYSTASVSWVSRLLLSRLKLNTQPMSTQPIAPQKVGVPALERSGLSAPLL